MKTVHDFAIPHHRQKGDVSLGIHRLRVNLKSLSQEARYIRQETRNADPKNKPILIEHRRGRLREEARLAHLALAFLRGRPFREVEGRGSKTVNAKALFNKLSRLGAPEGAVVGKLIEWLSE